VTAPRLASSVLVTALLRIAEGESGFGAVLASGDKDSGAILLVLAERGHRIRILERALTPDGLYIWREAIGAAHNADEFDRFLERARRFDRDSWILELDVPSVERFTAQLSALD
jgi:hypothetical protein